MLSVDAIAGKEEGKLSVCLAGLSVSCKAMRGQEDGDSFSRGGGLWETGGGAVSLLSYVHLHSTASPAHPQA